MITLMEYVFEVYTIMAQCQQRAVRKKASDMVVYYSPMLMLILQFLIYAVDYDAYQINQMEYAQEKVTC